MNTKKIIGFLLLRPFFNSRNLTSLALVAFFMAIYVLCGGKITAIPTSEMTPSFGALSGASVAEKDIDDSKAERAIDTKATVAQDTAEKKRGLFGNLTEDAAAPQQEASTATRNGSSSLEDQEAGSELVDMKKRLQQLGTSGK